MNFFNSKMAAQFFEWTMPNIAKAIEKIAISVSNHSEESDCFIAVDGALVPVIVSQRRQKISASNGKSVRTFIVRPAVDHGAILKKGTDYEVNLSEVYQAPPEHSRSFSLDALSSVSWTDFQSVPTVYLHPQAKTSPEFKALNNL